MNEPGADYTQFGAAAELFKVSEAVQEHMRAMQG
jgi:hypothetical protein